MQAGNGSSGNGHGADSPMAPVSSPGGTGAGAATNAKKPLPEALEKNKFKPGESGNKKGRPKGSISAPHAIHAILSGPSPKAKKLSNLAEFMEIAKARARKGDWRGAEIIFNKWAPDLRIPDTVEGSGGVHLNLNQYEQFIEQTEPKSRGDRPSFDPEN